MNHCGEWRIRTPGTRKGPPVFKTGAFDRSANSPNVNLCIALELFRFLSSQNFFWNDSTDFHQHKFQKKCLGSSLSHFLKIIIRVVPVAYKTR